MKMSDVFDLPLEYAGMCYQDQSGNCFGGNDYERESEVVKVINNHDALVELNKGLVEALESMTSLNEKMIRDFNGRVEPWIQQDEEHLHDAMMLVTKAKELPNDK